MKAIYSRKRTSGAPSLDRMRLLCRYIGDPQRKLKFVHVAGTNGKGSFTAMLDSVLRRAGYKIGRYVSPFITEFRERMTVNGDMIPRDTLVRLTERVETAAREMEKDVARAAKGGKTQFPVPQSMIDGEVTTSLVQFEMITAIAFLFFLEERCDAVLLECGLGGRFDATNVIDPPMLAVIMSIGLDHTELLGDTKEKIAAEKCGIIKKGTGEVVSAPQSDDVPGVIADACRAADVPLTVPKKSDIRITKASFSELCFVYRGRRYVSRLSAAYQTINASVVIEACEALVRLGMRISYKDISDGISSAYFPARFEVISLSPVAVVDGAHNESGIKAFCDSLDMVSERINGRIIFIVGMLLDKAPEAALKPFARLVSREHRRIGKIITMTPDSPRAQSAEELAETLRAMLPKSVDICAISGVGAEAEKALIAELGSEPEKLSNDDAVFSFGSLYLASDVRRILRNYFENNRR